MKALVKTISQASHPELSVYKPLADHHLSMILLANARNKDNMVMKLFDRKRRMLRLLVSVLFLSMLIAACGSGSSTTTGGNNGKGCKKIGVLLPDNATSARWESRDKPLLTQNIQAQLSGAAVDYTNAAGSDSEQQNQAGLRTWQKATVSWSWQP